jgi:type II secretory pathway component PulJ
MKIWTKQSSAGFTLVEMMVSLGCASIIFAAVLTAGVALQRSFAAVEAFSMSEGDQLRVQDYIAMDCRRATNVTVDNGAWANSGGTWSWVSNPSGALTLIFTIPSYYDASGNVQAPSFTAGGAIQYGTGGTTQISYYQSGTSFMRQIGTNATQCSTGAAWTNCARAIATNVNSFAVTAADLTTTVRCSITFSPKFTNPDTNANSTIVYANTFLRNATSRH